MDKMKQQYFCDYCHCELSDDQNTFVLKLELYASPELPEFTDADLERDHTAEILALLETMEGMDTEELTDEVYECYLFRLCQQCRKEIHRKLKHHKNKKQPI